MPEIGEYTSSARLPEEELRAGHMFRKLFTRDEEAGESFSALFIDWESSKAMGDNSEASNERF